MSELTCSFCSKNRNKVSQLIAGPNIGELTSHICNECNDLIHESLHNPKSEKTSEPLSPEQIKAHIDTYVVGQHEGKTILSVAIYNHFKRIKNPIVNNTVIDKSNIMLMGPSGTGKTLVAKTIASLLDLPIVIADCTALTETGYVGSDVDTIFDRLIKEAGGDIEKAQTGIVFIDEIDKKTNRSGKGQKDVSGEGVQQALLKLVEGDILAIPTQKTKKGLADEYVEFDTKQVLFIVGGSFAGLEDIVRKRLNQGSEIGLGATLVDKSKDADFLAAAEPEDLHQFGFIREFIGRFPVHVSFHNLDEELLVKILKEPKNNLLAQYQGLFHIDGVDLEFDDNYIQHVAKQCIARKVGARGLRSILEKSLTPVQFVLPRLSKEGVEKVVIDHTGTPQYTYRKKIDAQTTVNRHTT